jgi:hypothetical protein
MPAYDSAAFHPPAPLAMATVRSPASGANVTQVPMLIDSGADVTLLPRELILDLISNISSPPQYELEAFDGKKSMASVVQLELQFLGKSFRGQFLIVEGRHGVLGRNVLNAVSLLLVGPSLTWKENR